MTETPTEPTQDTSKSTYPSNEETVKTVIERLKNATTEISKAGNELYHIFGMEQPTGVVYDTLPLLEGAISYLERITTSEFEMNAE